MSKKLVLATLLLLTLLLSACSLPENGLCFDAKNITYNDVGGSGFLKVFNCPGELVSENISENISVEELFIPHIEIIKND